MKITPEQAVEFLNRMAIPENSTTKYNLDIVKLIESLQSKINKEEEKNEELEEMLISKRKLYKELITIKLGVEEREGKLKEENEKLKTIVNFSLTGDCSDEQTIIKGMTDKIGQQKLKLEMMSKQCNRCCIKDAYRVDG